MERFRVHRAVMRLTLSALFAALIFCSTFLIRVPIASGYIHAGDGFVFLAAVVLPAPYAAAAAALGAGLADFFGGYILWMPVTALIRAVCVLFFRRGGRILCRRNLLALALSAVLTSGGYYLFEAAAVYHSFSAALVSVPFNLLQSLLGAVLFLLLGKLAASHHLD